MIYSESSLARRIFSEFLPPWASRVGYIEGVAAPETLVPPHIFPIPLHVAPSATLDGIWVDSAHAPVTVQDLANTLACLGPGGVGVLFLPTRFWKRSQIKRFCTGAGMQVLFFSAVPSKGKMRVNRRGLPVPRNILRRFLLRFVTTFFPGLSFLFGSEWFIILQKGAGRSRETDGVRLSVIVPLPADRERARHRLREWEDFLTQHRMHDIQLVAVDETGGDPLEGMSGSTIRVHHYRSFGRSEAIRSGLIGARGKMILLDSERFLPPSLLFDLLQERFREATAADVISGYDGARQPFLWSRLLYRVITGLTRPDPLFMLLSDRAVRVVLDLHPEQLRGYAYAIPLHLRRERLKIREVPLHPDPPAPASSSPGPSLVRYLAYRFRRGAVYLSVLLWLPFAPQFMDLAGQEIRRWEGRLMPAARELVEPSLAFRREAMSRLDGDIKARWPAVEGAVMRFTHDTIPLYLASARESVPLPERAGRDFFFVLSLTAFLHFYNSVIVFRLSSGRIFAFLIALAEAGAIYFLKGVVDGMMEGRQSLLFGPFAEKGPVSVAMPFALSLAVTRMALYPLYSLVFRRKRGRSAA